MLEESKKSESCHITSALIRNVSYIIKKHRLVKTADYRLHPPDVTLQRMIHSVELFPAAC